MALHLLLLLLDAFLPLNVPAAEIASIAPLRVPPALLVAFLSGDLDPSLGLDRLDGRDRLDDGRDDRGSRAHLEVAHVVSLLAGGGGDVLLVGGPT